MCALKGCGFLSAAALGVAAVDALGGKLVRKGGRIAVEGLDAAGMSLLKRLPPEIHVALGLAADEAIDAAARKGAEIVVPKIYDRGR
ncbi:MAG: hypothetical protein AB7D00_06825 [Rhodospirillaceae bacterium]